MLFLSVKGMQGRLWARQVPGASKRGNAWLIPLSYIRDQQARMGTQVEKPPKTRMHYAESGLAAECGTAARSCTSNKQDVTCKTCVKIISRG